MPERTLFVGSRAAMGHWMHNRGMPQFEGGRTVHLASNGPEHLRGAVAPVRIVHERGWIPASPEVAHFVDEAISLANHINGQLVGEPIAAETWGP